MTDKVEFERGYIEAFLSSSHLVDGYELVTGDRPDVGVILADGRVVGIEVTRLSLDEGPNGSPEREAQGNLEAVRRAAAEECRRRGLTDLQVNISILPHSRIEPRERRGIAMRLVDLVVEHLREDRIGFDLDPGDREDRLPSPIGTLSAVRVPELGDCCWMLSGCGWLSPLTPAVIEQGLGRKEPKLSSYKQHLSECWLLLVCEGLSSASMLTIGDDVKRAQFRSSFDRAFVLDHTGSRWAELRLVR